MIDLKKRTLLVLDADLFVFSSAYHLRDQKNILGIRAAKSKLDSLIQATMEKSKADLYLGFYGIPGKENFRYRLATIRPYKEARGNRTDLWAEYFKEPLKNHMRDKWGFYGVGDLESDDAVSIAFKQYKNDYDVTLCFEDKDLKQIAFFNDCDISCYNPNKRDGGSKSFKITKHQGLRSYYWQCLHGDDGDSIVGIQGLGDKGAWKILDNFETSHSNITDEDYFQLVQDQYIKKYGEAYLPIMLENFGLLKMREHPCFDYPKEIELRKVTIAKNTTNLINI